MSVGRICIRTVILAARDESVADAASRMEREGVGTLVVTDALDTPVGILAMDDVLDLLVEETASIGRILRGQAPVGP